MRIKRIKKSAPIDDEIYDQFHYEKHLSFLESVKHFAVKIVDDFKRGQKLSKIKKQRKSPNKKNVRKPK